jgi:hypothetical protein
MTYSMGNNETARRDDLKKLTSANNYSMHTNPPTSGGRARFDQGSKRRDEYGRLNMGGDYVNNGSGGINARVPISDLDIKGKVNMQTMGSPAHLQLFLQLAQAKLALNDKYA